MEQIAHSIIQYLAPAFLLLALALCFFRLVKGPTMNDRLAALDLIASVTMGFILIYSILIKKAIYFDIAIVISLVSFIGTVAVATYLKQKR